MAMTRISMKDSDTTMSDTRMSVVVSMRISMAVSTRIGGSADNTNAKGSRIAPE